MRNSFGILAAAALALVLGGSVAQAAPVQTTGTLVVDLGPLGAFTVTGAGTVDVSGTGGGIMATTTGGAVISDATQINVPAGLVALPATLTITLTPNQTTLVTKITLQPGVGNATGTFNSGFVPAAGEQCPQGPQNGCVVGGGKGGIMTIIGTVTANLAGGFPVGVNLANFGIGKGGGATGLIAGEGAPFTTQTAVVNTVGGNLVTSAVGSGDEPITFVTPVALDALGSGLALFVNFSLDGIKMVQVVPEPGTLLLLASGVAGLAIAGRRRR